MTAGKKAFRSVWTYLNRTAHTLGYVDVAGVRTRYIEAGKPQNPTLVLLHGTAGSLENFCANYEELSQDYHVLSLDLLGCGYTDKPEFDYHIPDYAKHVLAFMDALNVEKASLIGVSLGSWIASWIAVNHETRVESVIAMAPAGIVVDAEEEKQFGADVRRRRSAAAAEPNWDTVTAAMGRLMLNQEDLIDDLVAVRLAIYQQESMKAAMGRLLAFTSGSDFIAQDQWAGMQAPILVVASVDAKNMFLDNAYLISKMAPHSELSEMTGCDHWPQFEQPAQFHSVALEFLGRCAGHKEGKINESQAIGAVDVSR
ncbi:alpha/beta fold hydrolase [Paeniglutamicibacter sp.]|uniref:alpha/beta fold hydrolase n=1 Tax=Paeniglutamicibacter sp. TaxID=1934391 RepID=UPI0039892FDC